MILEEAFEVHDTLNPKIWTSNNKLRPEVETKIIEIVDAFKEYIEIPIYVSDICLIGSNASYNYTAHSDLDVHIIANFELVDASPEILQSLYNTLRAKFKRDYPVTIHGVEVELFVEDVKTNAVTNGIYSVMMRRWIKFPKKLTGVTKYNLEKEVDFWTKRANKAIESGDKDDISKVISNIYLLRKNSLAIDGEYGKGNQLFKELRDREVLNDLKSAFNDAMAKSLSLESLTESYKLNEDSVHQLLSKSKATPKGVDRYKHRVKSKINHTPKQYNQIDMNKLFKDGILTVDVAVQGETDNYIVRISYGGFLDILHDQIKNSGSEEVNLKIITKTLITGFNRGDVYIHCTCSDFKYRYGYYATRNQINSGDPETRPSDITNPDDDMGCGCKHVLLVLTNTAWILKCATVVFNYIKYIQKHQKSLYEKTLYPAIYGKKYEEPQPEEPEEPEEVPNEENK